ncbi:MAG: hypothetical protein KAG82_02230 [Alcanivoracaceae bacterium]|jgi:hypothetical protein|nr:hypothetical protein [Alcanivoracaceae bacterium]
MDRTFSLTALAMTMFFLGACAKYQAHNGVEPQGYYEKQDDAGKMRVTYETWRPASEDKVCSMALRRAMELGFTENDVVDREWQQDTLFTDNLGPALTVRAVGATAWSDHKGLATIESGGYVDERTTRRCTLVMDSAQPDP